MIAPRCMYCGRSGHVAGSCPRKAKELAWQADLAALNTEIAINGLSRTMSIGFATLQAQIAIVARRLPK